MNSEQQKYIESLEYEFGRTSKLEMPLTSSFKEKLTNVETVEQLINIIKEVNCFGYRDSLIINLLGDS